MAKDLAEMFTPAKELLDRADEVLGYALSNIMFDGPEEMLRQTRYTQPAIFLHEATILEVTSVRETMFAVAGHSLGEYSALYAAGVLTFEDALGLVQLRASLMYEAGDKFPGTMAAVVGLDDDVVVQICAELNGVNGNVLVPANFNSLGQVVISGTADYLRQCLPEFKARGAKLVKELQVSGAFHSPLLADAEKGLATKISATAFAYPLVPVYVNISGLPVTDADELKVAAIRQLTSPVRWTDTMKSMASVGVNFFREIGPGKVLQGLVKRTVATATSDGVDTAADVQRVNEERSEHEDV